MKTDELLYEMMGEVSDREAELLDGLIQDGNMKDYLRKQQKLTMDKMKSQMQKDDKKRVHLFGRRRIVLIAAVMVMMLGVVAFARENDWDIEMAEQIGLSGAMEKLDGGYVKIHQSATQDGITVTAVQSIGDQNSQWIQFNTDIPWTVGEEGYYMFDDMSAYFTGRNGKPVTGGMQLYSYNNNGLVSFMLYAMDYEKINRAMVQIEFGTLRQYEDVDSEGVVMSEGCWELSWKNYYSSNIRTEHPCSMVDGLLVYKLELSPVSIRLEAVGMPSENHKSLTIESVTLQDGRIVVCEEDMVRGSTNNTFFESYVIYKNMEAVDTKEVRSIMVNGQEIILH